MQWDTKEGRDHRNRHDALEKHVKHVNEKKNQI